MPSTMEVSELGPGTSEGEGDASTHSGSDVELCGIPSFEDGWFRISLADPRDTKSHGCGCHLAGRPDWKEGLACSGAVECPRFPFAPETKEPGAPWSEKRT